MPIRKVIDVTCVLVIKEKLNPLIEYKPVSDSRIHEGKEKEGNAKGDHQGDQNRSAGMLYCLQLVSNSGIVAGLLFPCSLLLRHRRTSRENKPLHSPKDAYEEKGKQKLLTRDGEKAWEVFPQEKMLGEKDPLLKKAPQEEERDRIEGDIEKGISLMHSLPKQPRGQEQPQGEDSHAGEDHQGLHGGVVPVGDQPQKPVPQDQTEQDGQQPHEKGLELAVLKNRVLHPKASFPKRR